jgi:hypothetical protein
LIIVYFNFLEKKKNYYIIILAGGERKRAKAFFCREPILKTTAGF